MPMIYVSDIGKVLVAGYGSSSSIGTISTSGSDPLANSSGNTFGGQQDKAYYLIVGTENVLLKDFQTQLDKYNTLNNKDVSLEDISLKINVIESPSSSEGFSNILKADYSFKVQRISTFLGIKIGSSNENVIIPATYE
jgi:hypothetical protein